MYLFKRFFTVSCLVGLALQGCTKNPATGQESGSVTINLVADAASDFSAVARTSDVRVSAEGMVTLVQPLAVTSTGISGTVTGIAAGLNRKFEVLVYDASNKVCYYGSANAAITAGGTANVALTLYASTGEGNAIINGTIRSSNTPPVVSLTSPANNAQYPAGGAIQLIAAASDADGSITGVSFYNGTTLISTDTTAPYSCSFTAQNAGTYTFSAVATDNAGASTTSATVSVTVTAVNQVSYKINCGGAASSPFIADQNFSGGTAHTVTNAITTTGIANPAPQAVYQSERYGTTTYTLPNLITGAPYTVRLHFAELYQTATGKRRFNVVINGTTALSNFDIYAVAGARYKAVVREFTATPNASGQIVINLTTVTDNATIGGIEIIPAATAPVIVTQPQPQTAAIGQSVTFSVTASGGNLSYQWWRTGYGSYAITGATSPSYTIASVTAGSAGDSPDYYCIVTNGAGTVTSTSARLTILSQPAIVTQPQPQTAAIGQSVTFSVTASGGNLSYQWWRTGYGSYAITGATSSSYTIASVTAGSAGDSPDYYCIVTNGAGTVTSTSARLTILTLPVITADLPTTMTVNAGQTVTFSIVATGGNLSYQWYRTGYGSYAITGATSSTYIIPSADQFSSGDNPNYRCLVSNTAGTVWSSGCLLTVNP